MAAKHRKPSKRPAPGPVLCECGKYLRVVVVEGRSLCYGCHEGWLAGRGLGTVGRPDPLSSPPLAGWRPRL